MKRVALTFVLSSLLIAASAFAKPDSDKWDKDKDKDSITANEMVTGGFASAGVLAVAGYLVLRRRRTRSVRS